MRCSNCGADNRETARFCEGCGAQLSAQCPSCGALARAGARFCDSCGAALSGLTPAPPAAERVPLVQSASGERRHLTVLFCDLVGSTEIAARLDPEEWREVVAAYHRAATDAITLFGGYVAQYLGDGVMAYFGWPEAYDNNAERAARASLAILDAISKLNENPTRQQLSARVGIDSGAVVVGMSIGKSVDVFGDTPNIAARVQAIALPGTVVVTADTHRLISGLFIVEDCAPQVLKGIDRSIQLYRLVRPSGVRGRLEAIRAARGLTPFIGRNDELHLLMTRWERALEGEGQIVVISGEAGIGKSRLMQRFHEQIGGGLCNWVEGAAGPFFQNTPFYPVAEVLRQLSAHHGNELGRLNIGRRRQGYESPATLKAVRKSNHHPANGVSTKTEEQHGKLAASQEVSFAHELEFSPQLAVPFLDLLRPAEHPVSPQQRRRLLSALAQWVLGATHVMPLVIAIEDLHWADPSTLELIQILVEQAASAPLLLLGTARPDFRATWQGRTEITLRPLSAYETRIMVDQVACQKPLTEATATTVVERTGGVPFFIEELTRAVLDSGNFNAAARDIPGTLHDSLMARLDRLGPAKEVAQVGAVIGNEFSYELIAAIQPLGAGNLQSALRSLVDAQLLQTLDTDSGVTYRFKHALIRDTAYVALLKSRRRELHARIAQIIEERFSELASSDPEILAHHYTEAGLISEAVSYWRRAGRKAIERSAYTEAILQFRTGLELIETLPTNPERLVDELKLQIALTTPLIAMSGYSAPEVEKASRRALELCQQLGKAPQLFSALGSLQSIYFNRGELEIALEVAKQMLRLAERQQNGVSLLWAHYALGITLANQGKWNLAREHLSRSMALYDPRRAGHYGYVQDPGPTAIALLAHVLHSLGYPEQALGRMQEAVAKARSLAHPFTLAWVLDSAAELRWELGRAPQALELWEEQVHLCIKQGFNNLLALAHVRLGFAELEQGDHDHGLSKMREGLAGQMDFIDRLQAVAILALAEGKAGQVDKGLARIDDALVLAKKTPTFWLTTRLNLIKGQLLLMKSPSGLRKARQFFTRAIAIARNQKAKSEELAATIQLARVLNQQGRRNQARTMLAAIYSWFTEGFDTADLKDAKALLDELNQ